MAVNFKTNNLINNVDKLNLSAESYRNNSSNILTVLDSHTDKEKWQNQYYFKKREEWN